MLLKKLQIYVDITFHKYILKVSPLWNIACMLCWEKYRFKAQISSKFSYMGKNFMCLQAPEERRRKWRFNEDLVDISMICLGRCNEPCWSGQLLFVILLCNLHSTNSNAEKNFIIIWLSMPQTHFKAKQFKRDHFLWGHRVKVFPVR